jgi:hypothetical protein
MLTLSFLFLQGRQYFDGFPRFTMAARSYTSGVEARSSTEIWFLETYATTCDREIRRFPGAGRVLNVVGIRNSGSNMDDDWTQRQRVCGVTLIGSGHSQKS